MARPPKLEWERNGARSYSKAISPFDFVRQHTSPLFYRNTYQSTGGDHERFSTDQAFWAKAASIALASVCLEGFRLSDWFPRAPGVYWSNGAVRWREFSWTSPLKHDEELGPYYNPKAKGSMVEVGGVGTVRLRPRRIDSTDCWLATAVHGHQCAGGVPLAIPDFFLRKSKVAWGDKATIYGTVRFLQDAGLNDTAAYVHHASPVIIFVEKIEAVPEPIQSKIPVMLTPVALFAQEHGGSDLSRPRRGKFGYTYVQCSAGSEDQLADAVAWIEKYAQKHGGRLITNFDERSPLLADAPLSYQRLIKKNYERTIIENLHFNGVKLADRIDNVEGVVTEYNNYGQAGAMGENARSDNGTFVQSGPAKPVDLSELVKQLAQVRVELKRVADPDNAEQDAEIGLIAQAEKAAKSGEQSRAIGFLKGASKWALEVAKSVTAGMVKDAIEGKLG